MALSVIIMVGDSAQWIPEIVEKTKTLTVGAGWDNPDVTPLNNAEHLAKVERLIEDGAKHCEVLLDGRGVKVKGYPKGNFIGPTVIDHVRAGIDCYE